MVLSPSFNPGMRYNRMRWHKQIIIVALLGAAAGASGCGPPVNEVPLPAALMGRWTTTSPGYADRFLELSASNIVLGTGAGTAERYRITRVLRAQDDEGVLFTVEYTDSLRTDYAMSFYFDAGRGSLRFKNQLQMTWQKAAS